MYTTETDKTKDVNTANYIFYFKKIDEGSIVGVYDIEPDKIRKGWLLGRVIECGINDKIYPGANYNISADHVFNSGLYDYGKDLSVLI